MLFFFFSSRRRHTRYWRDWSSDVCCSDLSTTRLRISSTAPSTFRTGGWEARYARSFTGPSSEAAFRLRSEAPPSAIPSTLTTSCEIGELQWFEPLQQPARPCPASARRLTLSRRHR